MHATRGALRLSAPGGLAGCIKAVAALRTFLIILPNMPRGRWGGAMLLRVLSTIGAYVLACIAFAVVLVAFVFTPAELASLPAGVGGRISMAGFQVLASSIQVVIFAAPMALVATAMAEWRGIDEWFYYAVVGLLIAIVGFLAQYVSELQGAPTIVNNYAFTAFLTGGFAAGIVYWLVAGRHAAARRRAAEAEVARAADNTAATRAAAAARGMAGPVT